MKKYLLVTTMLAVLGSTVLLSSSVATSASAQDTPSNLAHIGGFIDEPNILRYVITVPFKGLEVESEE